MDPALERIATVDERAREQVRRAREYAASVAESRAGECLEAADAEREAVLARIADASRKSDDATEDAIGSAREAAEEKIRAIKRTEEEHGDAIAAAIVRTVTEGAL